jgi:hypothetical protein
MQSRFRRTGALVGTGAVLFGALAVVAGNQADAQQGPSPAPLDQLLGQPIQGKAALGKLQPRLAELAERNGIAQLQLERILATDKTSWLDKDGKLFYREPVATSKERSATAASPKVSKQVVTAYRSFAEGVQASRHRRGGSRLRVAQQGRLEPGDLPRLRRPHDHRHSMEHERQARDGEHHAVRHRWQPQQLEHGRAGCRA